MQPTQFLKTKEDIKAWLKKHKISYATLVKDATYGYAVNVRGSVFLDGKGLEVLPVKFNKVIGVFCINNNKLTSLEGSPQEVLGPFECNENNLTSLEHCPESIWGKLDAADNDIQNLEFIPKKVNQYVMLDNNPALGSLQKIRNYEALYEAHCAYRQVLEEQKMLNAQVNVSEQTENAKKTIKI